jgi:hypothetical protein
MASPTPLPLTPAQLRDRRNRVSRIARGLGFVGRVEYRHVYSQTGGAQYGLAADAANDLLTVFAEAFERDADPHEFSLEAIVAHERGHQLLARHPRIAGRVRGRMGAVGEEILASVLGSLICSVTADREDLRAKATFELLRRGVPGDAAVVRVEELTSLLGMLL